MNVEPSGAAAAARCIPRTEPAPGRLSTKTVCFSRLVSSGETIRATTSVLPPGAQGTSRRTGLSGQVAAPANAEALAQRIEKPRTKNRRALQVMSSLLTAGHALCVGIELHRLTAQRNVGGHLHGLQESVCLRPGYHLAAFRRRLVRVRRDDGVR